MKSVACLGSEGFTLGFQLAGIRHAVNVHDDRKLLDEIHTLRQRPEIGIVIVEERLLDTLDGHDRSEVEDSVEPVFVALATESRSDSIRKLIIKSIGVDLWKGES